MRSASLLAVLCLALPVRAEEPASPATGAGRRPEHPIEEPASPSTDAGRRPEHPIEERASPSTDAGRRSEHPEARQLVDEVVAVVDAHSITLSELAAETRVRLVWAQGPAAAQAPLDRRILAASLRKTVEERVVLSEVERLKLFDLERSEVDALLARLRARFASAAEYEAFTRSIELTEDEIGAVLVRELRAGRYLDNRLKLAAQLRDSELEEAIHGNKLSAHEREMLRERLAQEKYQRLLQELLTSLRERTTVRILDPLEAPASTVATEKGG
jgi:hypothetical protein